MKTILVPVDYSPDSKTALLYALGMASKARLKVIVFHAFYPAALPPIAYENPAYIRGLEQEQSKEVEKFVCDTQESLPRELVFNFKRNVVPQNGNPVSEENAPELHTIAAETNSNDKFTSRITCIAKMGEVQEQTLCVADIYDADLIVMGMQSRGTLSQVFVGSTTLSIMRNSWVPVLGVPLHSKYKGFRTVVFASDLCKPSDELQLRKLGSFIRTFKPKLEILHLHRKIDIQKEYEAIEEALQVLEEELYDIDYKVVLRRSTDVATGIQEYLREHTSNLLLLSPQKHTFLDNLLNKSVTAKMLLYSNSPMLTLPSSKFKRPYQGSKQAKEALDDTY